MIQDEIVTYEVAKLAKEKGFPQDVDRWMGELHSAMNSNYYNHKGELNGDCIEIIKRKIQKEEVPKEFELVAAPTQSLLQRWLREEKGIHISIDRDLDFNDKDYIYEWQASHKKELGDGCYRIITASDMEFYPTYEETLNAALKYALENLV